MGSRRTRRNPRALGVNPRALGTNPSAGTARDIERVGRLIARALHALHLGERYHCEPCADSGWIEQAVGTFARCADHRQMSSREAQVLLDGLERALSWAQVARWERCNYR